MTEPSTQGHPEQRRGVAEEIDAGGREASLQERKHEQRDWKEERAKIGSVWPSASPSRR